MDPTKIPFIVTESRRCPLCGHVNPRTVSDCDECGERLPVAGQVVSKSQPWPAYLPWLMILGGPPTAVVLCGIFMLILGDENDPAPVCLFAGSVLPFVGSLMLVKFHIAARIILAILFAFAGFAVSFIGAFMAWVMAGAPGFRMD